MLNALSVRGAAPPGESCLGGWTYYSGHCYWAPNASVNHSTAYDICVSFGANLTSVSNQTEMNYLLGISSVLLYCLGSLCASIGNHRCVSLILTN